MKDRAFYTYLWLREDGIPYYVGKGNKTTRRRGRAYRKGSPSEDRIIVQDHESEDAAFFAECFLIGFYGRKNIGTGCLINLTDGAEGAAGAIRSQESRRRMSESKKGKPLLKLRGRSRPDTVKVALREFRKNNPIQGYDPVEHSRAMSGSGNPMYGKKRVFDAAWREKLSSGKQGHTISEDTRHRMSVARTGRRYGERPTHCYRGHEFTAANTWVGKTGSRFCLQCRRLNHDAANERSRERRAVAH